MHSFVSFQQRIFSLLEAGAFDEAVHRLDLIAQIDQDAVAEDWRVPSPAVPVFLSSLYNNIGQIQLRKSTDAHKRTGDTAAFTTNVRAALRCHAKAFDLFDTAAEDILFLPADSPYNKNFILTLWGLGVCNYFLEQNDAARKYLLICLRMPPEDAQAAAWQSDASNYLHKLAQEPAQVVLEVRALRPVANQPDLWRIAGELVGWDAYARPVLESYTVYVDPLDRARLTRVSTGPTVQWEGRTLVLQTGPACDLFAPLRIIEIH